MAALTEEQTILRDQARAWTAEQAPVGAFRDMRDARLAQAFEPKTWTQMLELGWTGILVPEAHGGADLGYLTFGLVLEELGRQLTAAPLFASGFTSVAALRLGGSDAQQGQWLPGIVDGSVVMTLAHEEGPRHQPLPAACTAQRGGDGFVLSGQKQFVPEAMAATHYLVSVLCDDEVQLLVVPADVAGLERHAVPMVDSRGYGHLTFRDVTVPVEALLAGGSDLLEQTLDRARAGTAMEMIGTGAAAFDMTLEYLKTREQFGKVIGSFQALGHRAAELFAAMQLARSCAEAALQALDEDAAQAPRTRELVSLAKAKAGEFLFRMSNEMIQIHGGIGMTDEFDAGFYLKRARTLESAFGNQAFHRERYARLKGF
ncbi:MAG: acyl-CoA dehydrogenase family protein [Pseudomonadota bacterium]